MNIVWPHEMTKEAAKKTIEEMLPTMLKQYGGGVSDVIYEWRGDQVSFSGRVSLANLEGTLSVTDTDLVLEIDGVPYLFEDLAASQTEAWLRDNWPTNR